MNKMTTYEEDDIIRSIEDENEIGLDFILSIEYTSLDPIIHVELPLVIKQESHKQIRLKNE
jgi:hypothetical protein